MNFNETVQTWVRVLTRPGTAVFAEERTKPHATLRTALIWVLLAAAGTGILQALQMLIWGATSTFNRLNLPPPAENGSPLFGPGSAGITVITTVIVIPLVFLVGAGILHLLATLLGGRGDFAVYSYLLSSFYAPLLIVGGILGLIPFLGVCLALLIPVYQLFLGFFATQINYELSTGRALTVVLIPVIVGLFLFLCAILSLIATGVVLEGAG